MESKAIENVFGAKALDHELLVSSTKSMTGHLLGGAGGLEAGITIMAMLHQIAPPTMNIVELDPRCRLNYVPNVPVPAKIEYALSNSFGFGGTNGSLIFRRWTDD
jgi:3-oxoacyl-[acyl-carrier-protein] synthase II